MALLAFLAIRRKKRKRAAEASAGAGVVDPPTPYEMPNEDKKIYPYEMATDPDLVEAEGDERWSASEMDMTTAVSRSELDS